MNGIYHTTAVEVSFIRTLGAWAHDHGATRVQLLRKYRAALSKRAAWGCMDKDALLAEVDAALASEQKAPERGWK